MAFDFKKDNQGGSAPQNPFGSSGSSGASGSSGGFSFGGAGKEKKEGGSSGGFGFGNGSSGGSSGSGFGFGSGSSGGNSGGFQFPGKQESGQSGKGFSDLPAKFEGEKSNKPARRPAFGGSGYSKPSADIPWKAIIYVALIITVFALIVANWDLITYVVYNIISTLIVIIVLVIILKLLFRRRR